MLQLSYADTDPMFTSSSFPNFFRMVPNENAFNTPRIKLLQYFNWTRVGTIYQNEPRFSLVSSFRIFIFVSFFIFFLFLIIVPYSNYSFNTTRAFLRFVNLRKNKNNTCTEVKNEDKFRILCDAPHSYYVFFRIYFDTFDVVRFSVKLKLFDESLLSI